MASTRAMTYFSKAAAYKDTITFYETLCDLEAHFDERKEALTAKLKEMVSSIFTKEHLLVSVTLRKKTGFYRRNRAGKIYSNVI